MPRSMSRFDRFCHDHLVSVPPHYLASQSSFLFARPVSALLEVFSVVSFTKQNLVGIDPGFE